MSNPAGARFHISLCKCATPLASQYGSDGTRVQLRLSVGAELHVVLNF